MLAVGYTSKWPGAPAPARSSTLQSPITSPHTRCISYASIVLRAREQPSWPASPASPLHGRRPYPHSLLPCCTSPTRGTQPQICSTRLLLLGALSAERRRHLRIIEVNRPWLHAWTSARRCESVRGERDRGLPARRLRYVASWDSDSISLTARLALDEIGVIHGRIARRSDACTFES